MSLDVTAVASVVKETYPNGIVEIDYKRAKTLALLRKEKGALVEGSFGTAFKQPLKYSNPQAGSATYATGYAQASTEATRYTHWYLPPAELFQFARVSGAAVRRTQGSTASFVKALVSEIENAKLAMTRMIEIYLDGAGWGDLAQISSITTTAITLNYPWMARFFEIGQSICFSTSVSGAVLKAPTAGVTTKITAVNVSTGVLTTADDMTSGGTAVAANDYIFRNGDRQNSASPSRIVPCGFRAFLPDTDATRGTLFNVDQTLSQRLGGLRRDATLSGNMEEAFLDASADIDSQGGQSTHLVLGTNTYSKLGKSLLNKVYADIEDMDGVKLGFKGIVIQGASGDIICYSDSAFAEGRGRMFDVGDIGIQHVGDDICSIDQTDGLQFRQVDGTDDWMARLVASYQFHIDAPGHAETIINL
jgi:hypothetical protein